MSKKFTTLALVCALAVPSAFAQFSVPKLGALTGGDSGSSAAGNEAGQQDALVRAYVAANKDVLIAQSRMAEAVGLKERAAQLKSTADALGDGATKGNLSDADKIQSDSSKEISARLNDGNLQMDEKSSVRSRSCARIVEVSEFFMDSTSSASNTSARFPCKLAVMPRHLTDGDLSTPLRL